MQKPVTWLPGKASEATKMVHAFQTTPSGHFMTPSVCGWTPRGGVLAADGAAVTCRTCKARLRKMGHQARTWSPVREPMQLLLLLEMAA